jgi:hypothetical protein
VPRVPLSALASAGLVLALLALEAAPAFAGPPWISVEHPANPHQRDTRGALMLVHTYHHGTPTASPLSGTAEGLVSGERRSLPLEITPTARPGSYAVRGSIPREGAWIVVLTMTDTLGGRRARASTLVALGPRREVGTVRVPHDLDRGWMVPRAATAGEVEEMLRLAGALARVQPRPSADGPALGSAALGAVLLLPLALLRRRRGSTVGAAPRQGGGR